MQPPKIFTVVREPLDRFKSGFAQMIYDSYYFVDLTEEMIAAIIEGVFFGEHHMRSYQLFPMSNSLFEFDVDLIVKLEDIDTEWRDTVGPTYGWWDSSSSSSSSGNKNSNRDGDRNSGYDWDNSYGRRNHTFYGRTHHGDVPVLSDVRQQLETLLLHRPEMLKAICHHILVDYLCLEDFYQLPQECAFLESTLKKARDKLSSPP